MAQQHTGVLNIGSKQKFEEIIQTSQDIPVFCDFFATWCGPCVMIKPEFEKLANEYAGKAFFIKIDVDQCEDIAAQ